MGACPLRHQRQGDGVARSRRVDQQADVDDRDGAHQRGRRSSCSGRRSTADTGEWGTYAWNEHLLGAPGYRIAGGSDEIQRNIIGERVLGLPGEPRVDRDISFADLARARPAG